MIPFQFEIATAIAAVSVGGILTAYVTVLKRNGWIGKPVSNQSEPIQIEKQISQPTKKTRANKNQKSSKSQKPQVTAEAVPISPPEEQVDSVASDKKVVLKQKLAETLIEAQKSANAREVPRRCNNYFGYLFTLKKNAEIPDECYSCAKLIQCTQQKN